MNQLRRTALLIATCLAIAGACRQTATATGDSLLPAQDAPQGPLAGRTWVLTTLQGAPCEPIDQAKLPIIEFDSERNSAKGSTGVNQFSGHCDWTTISMRFAPLVTTRRAGPPQAMDREQAFLEALGRVTSWRMLGTASPCSRAAHPSPSSRPSRARAAQRNTVTRR